MPPPPLLTCGLVCRFLSELGLPDPRMIRRVSDHRVSAHNAPVRPRLDDGFTLVYDPDPALLPAEGTEPDGTIILCLNTVLPHVSGVVAPELATMKFLAIRTSIPVPIFLRSDSTRHNMLGREFVLLAKAKGVCLDTNWHRLTAEQKIGLVEQIADYMKQLSAFPFQGIGSIQESADNFVLGKYKDNLGWDMHPKPHPGWIGIEQVESDPLDIGGPFRDATSLQAAIFDRCAYVIEHYEDCSWLRDLVPRLGALSYFLRNSPKVKELKLNDTKLMLRHKELHFGRSSNPQASKA